MNLVLNVHTSLHYNLQGTYKINTHHAKIIQSLFHFLFQTHIGFHQFRTDHEKSKQGGAEPGAQSEPLPSTKTTSCPSLSRLKLT